LELQKFQKLHIGDFGGGYGRYRLDLEFSMKAIVTPWSLNEIKKLQFIINYNNGQSYLPSQAISFLTFPIYLLEAI